ncbi:hypothetical protein [Phytoactinopolyspora endophytica]|uniref:hypothetical protein n=1 Tax=Phytoactinopolyspora endophytica TaxID=1642495 RepID=UPI00101DF8FA|nr:hypothetical protein [Phytoactinopolyspora endophytica]
MTTPPHQPHDPYQRPDPRAQGADGGPGARMPASTGYGTAGTPYGQVNYGPPGGYPSRNTGSPTSLLDLVGAIVGLVATVFAVGFLMAGATSVQRSIALFGEGTDAVGVLQTVIGAAVLVGVVICAYWAPATALVPGALLTLVGLAGMISMDFTMELYEVLPETDSSPMVTTWIYTGATLSLGAVMTAMGVTSWIARARRRTLAR